MTIFTEIWYRTEKYSKLLLGYNVWQFLYCGLGITFHFLFISEWGRKEENHTACKVMTGIYFTLYAIQAILIIAGGVYTYINHKKHKQYQDLAEKVGLKDSQNQSRGLGVGLIYDDTRLYSVDDDDDFFEDFV